MCVYNIKIEASLTHALFEYGVRKRILNDYLQISRYTFAMKLMLTREIFHTYLKNDLKFGELLKK
jgi:hypothetical protein